MSFQTTAIKYGWVFLTSLGVLTGATIYSLINIRHQVKPEDIIEIYLGTYERCLATQTATNPITYSVSPTNLIQTWFSNVYTTNGVTVYTNIITNTIGWHLDRAYMIVLDAKIKALVPYYADTNTIYDGTTNIVMLTVTGLWASLSIGDGTNKFTREPAWTNPVSTNWVVNYTSYWPSTSGVATNINYTSDYRQVVNYAESWTTTGGHVWVTAGNWASMAVTITNQVTYGDYPWQIYTKDLEERYKVLNALKITQRITDGICTGEYNAPDYFEEGETWMASKNNAINDYTNYNTVSYDDPIFQCFTAGQMSTNAGGTNTKYMAWIRNFRTKFPNSEELRLSTNIIHSVYFYFLPSLPFTPTFPNHASTGAVFNNQGLTAQENVWNLTTTNIFGLIENLIPEWCAEPSSLTSDYLPDNDGIRSYYSSYGFIIKSGNQRFFIDWNFQYCTNKYW